MANRQNNDKASSLGLFTMAAAFAGLMVVIPHEVAWWVLGLSSVASGLTGYARLKEEQEQEQKRIDARTPSGTFGTAAFMTLVEAIKAGLTDARGLFIGVLDGRMLFHYGKAHLLTVAPARKGKGASVVIPNLLHWQHSAVVTDPKGELAAVTRAHRARRLGQKVIVLNPWGLHDMPKDRFNPIGHLPEMAADERGRRGLTTEVAAIALQLIPDNPRESSPFFSEGSRSILRALLLHLATSDAENCTLSELWRLVQNRQRLTDALYEMVLSEALDGVVSDLAQDLMASVKDTAPTFRNFLQGAQQAVAIFDPSGWIADCVDRSDFSFAELKSGKVTVYLVVPPKEIAAVGPWMGLVVRRAIDDVAAAKGGSQVLFMLDEVANMGKLQGLSESLTLLPALGVRVWMIVQSLDQLRAVYGRETTNTILSQAEVKQYFVVEDAALADQLSKALGMRTVKVATIGLGRDKEDDPTESWSETQRPLMSADQIRALPASEQIVQIQSQPPIRAGRLAYWQVAPWQDWAAPNPCEGGSPPKLAPVCQLTYRGKTDG